MYLIQISEIHVNNLNYALDKKIYSSLSRKNLLFNLMNNIKIEELMKVRFDGIASRIGQLSKRESESLLLEHLEWLEGGWETEEILFLKKPYRKWWF